ncbi:hypothetical protein [Planosporangium thailandense]|uniref:hypothetical protein n=1 Tax=Planosporangium thailandense TaxID=765197 RepID=UPI001F0F325F|nr:hypothetical protein [Planosporangium thailandense]
MADDATAPEPAAAHTAPDGRAGTEASRLDMVAWAVRRIERRRSRIAAEIERNRRGEPAIPTWILAVALIAILGAWAAVVLLS